VHHACSAADGAYVRFQRLLACPATPSLPLKTFRTTGNSSILNLPTTASDKEIRERYRQLSVVFHPDKQHDESTKETATKRFLEIQKAYQVLSDPISRRAYDLLGLRGLKTIHNADLSRVPPEEFESALVYKTRELERERAEHIVRSKGRIIAAIDASPVFETDTYDESFVSRLRSLPERLGKIREQSFSVRHTVQTDVLEKTTMTFSGRAWTRGSFDPDDAFAQMRTAVMGTVRHQYSPRLQFEVRANQQSTLFYLHLNITLGYDESPASL